MVGVARGHQRANTLKPYSPNTSQSNHTRTTALSNSMKLSHAHGVTQDGWVMVERSDRMWSTGEGNGKTLQYSCLEYPINSMKRQNERILKEELPGRFSSVHYSLSIMSDSLRHHELQCASPLCPSPTPRVHSDSHPSCQ